MALLATIDILVSAGTTPALVAASVGVQGTALAVLLLWARRGVGAKRAMRLPSSTSGRLAVCVLAWTAVVGATTITAVVGVFAGRRTADVAQSSVSLVLEAGRLFFVVGLWAIVRVAGRVPLTHAGLPARRTAHDRIDAVTVLVGYAAALLVTKFLLSPVLGWLRIPPDPSNTPAHWGSWAVLLVLATTAGPFEELLFAAIPVIVFTTGTTHSTAKTLTDASAARWAVPTGATVLLIVASGVYRAAAHLRYANPTDGPPPDLQNALLAAAAVVMWGLLWGGGAVALMYRYGRLIPLIAAHTFTNVPAVLGSAPGYAGIVMKLALVLLAVMIAQIPLTERPRWLYERFRSGIVGATTSSGTPAPT